MVSTTNWTTSPDGLLELDAGPAAEANEDAARRDLGFGSFAQESVHDDLEVEGDFPRWLTGTLLRSGVSQFEGPGWRMRHWFDGMAMLHAFTFIDGRVAYRNRMLRSRAYTGAIEKGHLVRTEFGTDPCRSFFSRMNTLFHGAATDNGAITVNRLGDEFVAMTEAPMPVQFDRATLETTSVDHRAKAPGAFSAAHAHVDGEGIVNYALAMGRRPAYRFYTVGAEGGAHVVAQTPARRPRYVHSFGATEEHLVLVLGPLVLNLPRLLSYPITHRPFVDWFDWKPELGTQILVLDRRTGELVREFTTETMFCFHHANAYRDGEELVVDLVTYPDAAVVEILALDQLRHGSERLPQSTLRRLRLPLAGGRVGSQTLWDGLFELPRVNYAAVNGRPYRFVYGVTATTRTPYWFSGLAKVDVTGEQEVRAWAGPGRYPSEPVFVARPGGTAEDDGVVLSLTLDTVAGTSELTVLDAAGLTERARAKVPHAMPFGFHSYHHADIGRPGLHADA